MITINGTDYAHPSNLQVISYSGAEHALVGVGQAVRRVAIAELSPSSHRHLGEIIWPEAVKGSTGLLLRTESGNISFQVAGTATQMILTGERSTVGKSIIYHDNIICGRWNKLGWGLNGADTPQSENDQGVKLPNTPGRGAILAHAYSTHACSLAWKEDVQPISHPDAKMNVLTGITFRQNGVPGTGVAFEDLESLGLPGMTTRDENNAPYSINTMNLIPLLIEAHKDLMRVVAAMRDELDVAKEKIKELEAL